MVVRLFSDFNTVKRTNAKNAFEWNNVFLTRKKKLPRSNYQGQNTTAVPAYLQAVSYKRFNKKVIKAVDLKKVIQAIIYVI